MAEIALPEEEAHHAARVVRVRPGEQVALFDGQGREWVGRVSRVDRRDVTVSVESERREPLPAGRLTLLQSWLKRDRHTEEIIRHGTELGVRRFVFFRAARSEKAPALDAKWGRWAVETCKQCGRLWLPEFDVASDFAGALGLAQGTLLVATADRRPAPLRNSIRGPEATLAIGPEGDFTPEELDEAEGRGARPVSLGGMTYRSEVAAFLGAALVLYELGVLGPLPDRPAVD